MKRPVALMVPAPLLAVVMLQVGVAVTALPYWSVTVAVNCFVVRPATEGLFGVMVTMAAGPGVTVIELTDAKTEPDCARMAFAKVPVWVPALKRPLPSMVPALVLVMDQFT